jgi:hypothetical protein
MGGACRAGWRLELSGSPLTLSLSPWERERQLQPSSKGPLSQGERDRVRGDPPVWNTTHRYLKRVTA